MCNVFRKKRLRETRGTAEGSVPLDSVDLRPLGQDFLKRSLCLASAQAEYYGGRRKIMTRGNASLEGCVEGREEAEMGDIMREMERER